MKPYSNLKAIIFDYDGVLVNSQPFHFMAISNTAKHFKLPFNKFDYHQFYEPGVSLVSGTNSFLSSRHRLDIFNDFIAHKKTYDTQYHVQITPVPGAIEFIHQAILNYRLAIVTGTREILINQFIEKFSLTNIFSPILTVENITKDKPDPEGYLLALNKLKLQPNQAVVIEDGQKGIDAAVSAHIPVIGLQISDSQLQNCTDVCSSFSQISQLLSV